MFTQRREFCYGFKLLRLALRFQMFSCRYRVRPTLNRKHFVPFSKSAGIVWTGSNITQKVKTARIRVRVNIHKLIKVSIMWHNLSRTIWNSLLTTSCSKLFLATATLAHDTFNISIPLKPKTPPVIKYIGNETEGVYVKSPGRCDRLTTALKEKNELLLH